MRWLAVAACAVRACHDEDWLQYSWNDRRDAILQLVDKVRVSPGPCPY